MKKIWAALAGAAVVILAIPVLCFGIVIAFVAGSPQADALGAQCAPKTVPAVSVNGGAGNFTTKNAAGTTVTLNISQLGYAAQIVAVGKKLGVSASAIQTAFVTVFQESMFRMYANSTVPESLGLPHDSVGADHDSVGLFQQRANWGSVAVRMDATKSAEAFFGGPTGPNKGRPAGLIDQPDWQALPIGAAAQKVQVSAFPDAYAKWVPAAQDLYGRVVNGYGCAANPSGQFGSPAGANGNAVVAYASQYVGIVPYTAACGSNGSPTNGFCCTGLVYWVYHNVMNIDLPEVVVSGQITHMHVIPQTQAQAGDLVVWVGHHIAIYDGKGGIIHAPDFGRKVEHNSDAVFSINGVQPVFMRVDQIGAGSW